MRHSILTLCFCFTLLAAFPACTATKSKPGATASAAKPKAGRFMVSVKKSPFYKYGPAQAFGPDFALPQGHKLTLIDQSFGFSRVMTDDGIAGFMPTEDLVPASPDPLPPAAPRMASRRGRSGSGSGEGFYNGPVRKSRPIEPMEDAPPLFDVFDVPLPTDPEPAESKEKADAKPKFRVR